MSPPRLVFQLDSLLPTQRTRDLGSSRGDERITSKPKVDVNPASTRIGVSMQPVTSLRSRVQSMCATCQCSLSHAA